MSNIPMVDFSKLDSPRVDKNGRLRMSSECIGMPKEFFLESTVTGRIVIFKRIGPEHPEYDEDGWDGEQAIYEPGFSEFSTKVKTLVIYNQY